MRSVQLITTYNSTNRNIFHHVEIFGVSINNTILFQNFRYKTCIEGISLVDVCSSAHIPDMLHMMHTTMILSTQDS